MENLEKIDSKKNNKKYLFNFIKENPVDFLHALYGSEEDLEQLLKDLMPKKHEE